MFEKNYLVRCRKVKSSLEEAGVWLSKPTIKRLIHEWKYSVFTTTCKLLIALRNRKARLARSHPKRRCTALGKIFGQLKVRLTGLYSQHFIVSKANCKSNPGEKPNIL